MCRTIGAAKKRTCTYSSTEQAMTQSRTFKAAILSSGQFLATLTSLILAAVLARLFTKEDYAAYRQTLLAYAFVAPLLALGLPQALYYFIPRDKENGRSILTSNILLLFLAGGIFAAAMWCGGNELLARRFSNPVLSRLLLIFSPYALLALPVSTVSACLMSCDRVKTLAVYNMASRILTVILIISLVFVWRTPDASISATVLAELLIFVPAIILMYRATAGTGWRPNITNIRQQIKYSIPLGLASTLGVITLSLDKIIVSSMCTPEQFAVYVNGAIEIPLIGILTGSVTAVLMPDIVQFYKEGNNAAALELWKRAAVKCAMILLPVMCFLFFMAPEVMRVLFSAKYADSVRPFRIYLLLLPIRTVTWGQMLMAAGKTRWVLYITAVTLILNLALGLIMVRWMGYIGAAVATVITIYVWNIPFCVAAISKLYLAPFWSVFPWYKYSKIGLISALSSLFCLWPRMLVSSDLFRITLAAPVYVALVVVLMLKFRLLEKNALVAILKRVKLSVLG